MGLYKYRDVGLKYLSATVPKKVVRTHDFVTCYSEDSINKFIEATGVEERRFATNDVCASDLCCNAANEIFMQTDLCREDIDVLIFVTQTPDFKIPGNSILMQDRLKLSSDTLTYDVNMSCSGFIHGLLMAYSFLQSSSVDYVMLLVGDTLSKLISTRDKGTGLLLGDAGIAAVLGKDKNFGESWFSMNTEGNNLQSVFLPAGGCRLPSSYSTLEMNTYEDGSVRNKEQIVMVGPDVFSFAISHLPKDVKKMLDFSGKAITDVDKFVFHQANNFMMDYIAKKCKVDRTKILHSIQKYGNTAGTSIPLCLVENQNIINTNDLILMNAIGAGFTYGSVLLNLSDCRILPLTNL